MKEEKIYAETEAEKSLLILYRKISNKNFATGAITIPHEETAIDIIVRKAECFDSSNVRELINKAKLNGIIP